MVGPRLPKPIEEIVESVAARHRIPRRVIFSDARHNYVAHARWEMWWRIRHLEGRKEPISFSQIGRWFKRDHTSVRHGYNKYDKEWINRNDQAD